MECNREATYAKLAVRFANALVAGDFDQAHTLLSAELRSGLTPSSLREIYEAMVEYGDGSPTDVELIVTMEQWQLPEQHPTDLGWAYVAIAGDSYSEAVTVIVENIDGEPAIRHLEWGRP
ncbi:hypothetical protein [Phormidium tenue]|uniref:Uncharacterized protein n=1 Tax=Phormidium tenue NIES-30 TaxID=549789 RepID=A0A1U7J8C5_9CYAN|nr:hypothetical protein [Phormidium tenue]MBD2231308.1 hypothetical protein [Phormidium tenue FACHB-1052]OKH49548.1 hypothetical protein NIES30_06810 [Phormidium tenue NIES-30]